MKSGIYLCCYMFSAVDKDSFTFFTVLADRVCRFRVVSFFLKSFAGFCSMLLSCWSDLHHAAA